MDDIEESSTICKGYEGPCRAVTHVDYELLLSNVYGFEFETRSSILFQTPIFWIQGLVGSNLLPINTQIPNGSDDPSHVVHCSVSSCC